MAKTKFASFKALEINKKSCFFELAFAKDTFSLFRIL